MSRRILFLIILAAVSAADVALFRVADSVARVKKEISAEARIAILEKVPAGIRLNDEFYRLLGKAHFDAGSEQMGRAAIRDAHFQAAQTALRKSLALNPLSAAAHFDLAQGLEYFNLVGIPSDLRPFEEYLNAARLGVQDPEIIDASGRLLFSKWSALNTAEKRLTQNLLRTIMAGGKEEKWEDIFNIWALYVQDYDVLKSILPAQAAADRGLALFLAERSLDRTERIEALVRAESLEFNQARSAYAEGRREFQSFNMKEAEAQYRRGLGLLQGIRFYQRLAGRAVIDAAEVRTLRRTLALGVVECRLEKSVPFDEILPDVLLYLEVEDSVAGVGDLEQLLRARRLIGARMDAAGKDLRRLTLEMRIAFKQNRFQEISEAGQALVNGILIVPEAARKNYAEVLELVGDAYQKLDFLYESNAFYEKARAADGGGIAILFKLQRNFERLNDAAGLRAIEADLRKSAASQTGDGSAVVVPKGTALARTIQLDGREIRLALHLEWNEAAPRPYLAINFNGLVIWEDFAPENGILGLDLTPRLGENRLEIQPWNGALTLAGLDFKPLSAATPETVSKAEKSPVGRPIRKPDVRCP
jgi:hypothetical protein